MNVTSLTTDPRIVKQLLMTQWMTGVDPLSATTAGMANGVTGSEDSGLFSMLLNQLLGSSGTSDDGLFQTGSLNSMPLSMSYSALTGGLTGDLTANYGSTLSSSAYDELIAVAGAKYGVSPSLIKGVIQSESSFRSDAVSSAGAKGLMQLMDETARSLGVTDSFDPNQNIDGGTRFLSFLLRKYDGSAPIALAAYNAGPGRIDRLGIATEQDLTAKYDQLPRETQDYIGKVLNAARQWSAQAALNW